MRLMQAMAGAEFGGAEAFFVRLAGAFARAGVEQRVLIRSHPARARLLQRDGLDPIQLPFGGLFDRKTGRGFRNLIADFRPQVVLTWMGRATRFCPKKQGNSQGFVHVARLGGYYDLKYYRGCDHLIGNTRDIVDYLTASGWPAERGHYLPNFVSATRADPQDRAELSTPPAARVVLALGRLHANKAFDVLIEAMARVPDAYLWLAGEGPERTRLEALAERRGVRPRIRFLGWRDDTAALFAACDVFVCPSRHEPLGNVVLEAWAQGVPVVAADSLGPGTLIDSGRTGLLVPLEDPAALAGAIRHLLQRPDEADRLAANGHEAFAAEFTEQAVVSRYLDFFDKVAR